MRFPLSLTLSTAGYMLRKKLSGVKKFPLVLMLEPLHACNLKCNGCGRIREYADTLGQRLSVDECLQAVRECGAPIVSICGGEPLLHPSIVELTDRILHLGKHIYLCTNGTLLKKKLPDFIQLAQQNRQTKNRLYWNVHLDGTADIHDAITGQPGTFEQALAGIIAAKEAGFYVYTNTTLYKTATVSDIVALAERLHSVNIDGMMVAPGYNFASGARGQEHSDVVQKDSFFLNRTEIHELFKEIRQKLNHFRTTATPIYLDYLCGERQLPCAAWANPTRNVKGWKSPCYLITDKHCDTFQELMEQTDWSKIGYIDEQGNDRPEGEYRNDRPEGEDRNKDVRCQDCMMHCGYEPAAVLFGNRVRDLIRLALWQMGG